MLRCQHPVISEQAALFLGPEAFRRRCKALAFAAMMRGLQFYDKQLCVRIFRKSIMVLPVPLNQAKMTKAKMARAKIAKATRSTKGAVPATQAKDGVPDCDSRSTIEVSFLSAQHEQARPR